MSRRAVPTAVPSVDLQRLAGTWYEIARLPAPLKHRDYRNITVTFTPLEDGALRIANRSIDPEGHALEAIGEAEQVEGSNGARFELSYLPEALRWIPFTDRDYWFLRLDPDYQVALAGTPGRKRLWLLAREPHIDPAVREDYLATARAQGFDLATLIDTPQDGA